MKAKRTRENKMTTVRGILIPLDWDKQGMVIGVGLSGRDEKEYLIDDHEKQKELLKFIQKEVELSGVVRETKDGKKIMTVKRYKLF